MYWYAPDKLELSAGAHGWSRLPYGWILAGVAAEPETGGFERNPGWIRITRNEAPWADDRQRSFA